MRFALLVISIGQAKLVFENLNGFGVEKCSWQRKGFFFSRMYYFTPVLFLCFSLPHKKKKVQKRRENFFLSSYRGWKNFWHRERERRFQSESNSDCSLILGLGFPTVRFGFYNHTLWAICAYPSPLRTKVFQLIR